MIMPNITDIDSWLFKHRLQSVKSNMRKAEMRKVLQETNPQGHSADDASYVTQNHHYTVLSFSINTQLDMLSLLGGSRIGFQGADNGRCSSQSPPLSQLSSRKPWSSCCPLHQESLGRMTGMWWHINNWVTTGLAHLWVINMAHLNPSHAPLDPLPKWTAYSDSSCQTLIFPDWGRVSACVCMGMGVTGWGVYGVMLSD